MCHVYIFFIFSGSKKWYSACSCFHPNVLYIKISWHWCHGIYIRSIRSRIALAEPRSTNVPGGCATMVLKARKGRRLLAIHVMLGVCVAESSLLPKERSAPSKQLSKRSLVDTKGAKTSKVHSHFAANQFKFKVLDVFLWFLHTSLYMHACMHNVLYKTHICRNSSVNCACDIQDRSIIYMVNIPKWMPSDSRAAVHIPVQRVVGVPEGSETSKVSLGRKRYALVGSSCTDGLLPLSSTPP